MDAYDNDRPNDVSHDDPYAGFALDAAGRLAFDLPCTACGYNLRGQLPGGACPECGAPVASSRHNPRSALSKAPPQWIARLGSGAAWIITGSLVGLALSVASVCLSYMNGTAAAAPPRLTWPGIAYWSVSSLAALIFLVGVFRITTPGPTSASNARDIARWGLTASQCAALFAALCFYDQSIKAIQIGLGAYLIGLGLLNVGVFALNCYLLELARSTGDKGLASQYFFVLWMVFYAMLAATIAFVALAVQVGVAQPAAVLDWMDYRATLLVLGLSTLVMLGAYVWWIALLYVFRRRCSEAVSLAVYFKSQARQARRSEH